MAHVSSAFSELARLSRGGVAHEVRCSAVQPVALLWGASCGVQCVLRSTWHRMLGRPLLVQKVLSQEACGHYVVLVVLQARCGQQYCGLVALSLQQSRVCPLNSWHLDGCSCASLATVLPFYGDIQTHASDICACLCARSVVACHS